MAGFVWAAMPSSGLGDAKAAAWSLIITEGFAEGARRHVGRFGELELSTVSVIDAMSPMNAPMTYSRQRCRGAGGSGCGAGGGGRSGRCRWRRWSWSPPVRVGGAFRGLTTSRAPLVDRSLNFFKDSSWPAEAGSDAHHRNFAPTAAPRVTGRNHRGEVPTVLTVGRFGVGDLAEGL